MLWLAYSWQIAKPVTYTDSPFYHTVSPFKKKKGSRVISV